ncbi:MAG: hypothetical protein RL189_537 [Pseudomonadota bacterium]|jgi:lysophospholipid acyltransferase (LPLAT)-like uncharacterized protein
MNFLVSLLLEIFWKLWTSTIRLEVQGLEAVDRDRKEGFVPVFAVPHHAILLSALAYRGRPATLLASLSKDGEFAARFLAKRGFKLVRGSSSRGGKEALANLQDALNQGQPVAITFDGPRGPRLIPKAGVAVCGWHATGGVYLVKAAVRPSRFTSAGLCLRLNSWDRFIIPLPFCRLNVDFARLDLPEKKEHPLEEWVCHALAHIRREAETFYAEPSGALMSEAGGT